MPKNVKTLMSSEYNIREELKHADLVIGSVLIPGAKAPKLVTRDMLREMEPGSVMVDVAIDQGGCFETSRPTTHEDPVYYVDGILHYCVANIPGAVPYSSTLALTNATLPYVVQLADKGWRRACKENRELELGLNIVQGKVVYRPVAEAWGFPASRWRCNVPALDHEAERQNDRSAFYFEILIFYRILDNTIHNPPAYDYILCSLIVASVIRFSA